MPGIRRGARVRWMVIGLLGLALVPGESAAQRGGRDAARERGGLFGIGASSLDVGELNDRLRQQGYPTFGNTALVLGGGRYGILTGGLRLGGEGYAIWLGEEEHDARTVRLGGGYGLFTVGYVLEVSSRARIYPLVGIGGGAVELRIGSRTEPTVFDGVLANPGRQAVLRRGSFLVDLGAGAEHRLRDRPRSPSLGVRVGYLVAPGGGTWRLEEMTVGGGPDASPAGPYARVTIGGGRRR